MSFSVGPLTVSWGGQNQSSNRFNVSAPVATGLLATGVILGVAGTYAAPKVLPPVTKFMGEAKDKTVSTVQNLFYKKVENVEDKKPAADNKEVTQPTSRRWYFLWLA